MSEGQLDLGSADKRRTLWIVLALNVAIAVGFFATGLFGESSALIANGLDNSSDATVYAISLLALARPPRWKRGAARLSGIMLLVFAEGVLVDAARRFVAGFDLLVVDAIWPEGEQRPKSKPYWRVLLSRFADPCGRSTGAGTAGDCRATCQRRNVDHPYRFRFHTKDERSAVALVCPSPKERRQ